MARRKNATEDITEKRAIYQDFVTEGSATALTSKTRVQKGGCRCETGGVQIILMNVLQESATALELRIRLLEEVISTIRVQGPTVILTPAGYFGLNAPHGDGRGSLSAAALDRKAAIEQVRMLMAHQSHYLLLAIGIDDDPQGTDWRIAQHLYLLKGGDTPDEIKITRGNTGLKDRVYPFYGLRFFGVICSEFQRGREFGRMFPEYNRDAYFDAERDLPEVQPDVILNAAHIRIKCTQEPGKKALWFPFEKFAREVSAWGAAAFFAHHHPNERRYDDIFKNHSYSTWGVFSGDGHFKDFRDWMNRRELPKEVSV